MEKTERESVYSFTCFNCSKLAFNHLKLLTNTSRQHSTQCEMLKNSELISSSEDLHCLNGEFRRLINKLRLRW